MNRFFILVLLVFPVLLITAQEEGKDALALYRNGQYQRAIEVCLEELEENPGNMDSYAVLGWSLLATRQYQRAVEYGLRAYERSPADHRIVHTLGEAYFRLNQYLKSLNFMERYIVLAPENSSLIGPTYYVMGEIFIQLGEFNHADIALTTAVYHNQEKHVWWSRLGYARENIKDYKFALEAYQQALTLNPSFREALEGQQRVIEESGLTGG
ncbi:MAG: tetratricopeptide repeat protein [Spirochaetia bacterium]